MRKNLEDDLARTFRAAEQAAPDPEPEFRKAVAARRRRRIRNRVTVAVTAVVAVGAAAFGLTTVRQTDPPTLDARPLATGKLPTVDLSAAKPYREVWPDAYVELPYPLPDGRRYEVVAALDADNYLLRPWTTVPVFPVVLNARTGAVRELATVPASGYQKYEAAGLGVTENNIFWIAVAEETGGASYREIWSAPKGGGPAVSRARLRFGPDQALDIRVAEVGGTFYASVRNLTDVRNADEPGVIYQIPDGGAPQKVPDSDGYALRDGPWAVPHGVGLVDVTTLGEEREPAPAEIPTYWNIVTGERRTPRTLHGVTVIGCGPFACLGHAADTFVSYGYDGKRPLRATGVPVSPRADVFFDSAGRFVQIRPGSSDRAAYLWDRRTNRVGGQPESPIPMDMGVLDLGQRDGAQLVLNLARIR